MMKSKKRCYDCDRPIGYFRWRAGIRLCKPCIKEGMAAKRAHEVRVDKLREAMMDELKRAARVANEMIDELERAARVADGIEVPATQEGGIIR